MFVWYNNKHGGLDLIIGVTMEMKEVTHIAIQIDKLQKERNFEDLSCLLTDIYNTNVTLEHLQSTDIAKNIYQLLKACPVESVRKRGKSVLSKWKRLYNSLRREKNIEDTNQIKDCEAIKQDEPEAVKQDIDRKGNDKERRLCFEVEESNGDHESSDSSFVDDALSKAKMVPEDSSRLTPEEDSRKIEEDSTLSLLPFVSSSTNSPLLRNKCVELLIQALNSDKENPEFVNQLARTIEMHIDALHGCNPSKYKSCIRSKVANLKNLKNPHLRQGLLTGTLAPEVFAKMSAQEMASEELRQLRQCYTAAAVNEHQLPQGPEGTATTKVRCKRCEGTDCRVTQISRGTLFLPSWVKRGSADEEAMTFMTCGNCGAQWYHNRWVCL